MMQTHPTYSGFLVTIMEWQSALAAVVSLPLPERHRDLRIQEAMSEDISKSFELTHSTSAMEGVV